MSSNPPATTIGIKILTGEHEIFSQAASGPFLHWLASCMSSKIYFSQGLIQVVRLRHSFFFTSGSLRRFQLFRKDVAISVIRFYPFV